MATTLPVCEANKRGLGVGGADLLLLWDAALACLNDSSEVADELQVAMAAWQRADGAEREAPALGLRRLGGVSC